MKARKTNSYSARCSARDCSVPGGRSIPAGQGFFHGLRGPNKSYYFLCAVCDAAEQAVRKATRERKQALEKKNDAKPKPLFEYQVIKPLPCGCTGGK
jgi:hypothetical protein